MLISILRILVKRQFLIPSMVWKRKSVSLRSWRLTSRDVVFFHGFCSEGTEVGHDQWKQQTCTVCVRCHRSGADVKTGFGNPFSTRLAFAGHSESSGLYWFSGINRLFSGKDEQKEEAIGGWASGNVVLGPCWTGDWLGCLSVHFSLHRWA